MAMDRAAFDRRFMTIALRLARRGLGTTAPNPSVGAVIVDEGSGEVIARGSTQPGGRPHAETEALARAGERARGATLYVTLEPCSHHGKTPPCAAAVIGAGIARVVVGIEDPDPRVSGRGLEGLRAAGITVERGVCAEEADWLSRGHILRVTELRPFVQLKLALASSGEAPRGAGGTPAWVTGPEARARGHLLRANADAILVGRRTIEDDDPELTCRLPGLAWRSPTRVVLARDLAVDPRAKLPRSSAESPVLIFCGLDPDAGRRDALERQGCQVIPVREVGGRLWLPAVAEELAARGVTRLLVEGGPTVWREFAQAAMADEVILFQARPIGWAPPSDAQALEHVRRHVPLERLILLERAAVGTDDMMVFRRARHRRPRPAPGGDPTG